MRYNDKGTKKVKEALDVLNKTAKELFTPSGVAIIDELINPHHKMWKAKRKLSKRSKDVIRHTEQIIARNLLVIHHNEHGATNMDPGYVYIISNPAWPNWFKIGSTIDVIDRNSNYQTYSPFRDFSVEFYFFTFNRLIDEYKIINHFKGNGEWVNTSLDSLKEFSKQISPYGYGIKI